ncbi:DUF1566 domain-containing protein [Patescibacteria group bacterium]|nr:DUF1566 domain-containing protein [Patescibacteria group bacterium]
MHKKSYTSIWAVLIALILTGGLVLAINRAQAEQSGGSPESGATSRLKTLYDSLVASGYGSDSNTPDWGTDWNRIQTAATWTPSGNATAGDVASGKTFYGGNRTQVTGTYSKPQPCPDQAFHDNYGGSVTTTTNCNLTWTVPGDGITGTDHQDPVNGLIWSYLILDSSHTAVFSASSGSTFNWNGQFNFTVSSANATAGAVYSNNGANFTVVSTITGGTTLTVNSPTGKPAGSGTLTKVSGTGDATITFSAIANNGGSNGDVGGVTAMQLCANMGNGWRLPSQKELMQAYIDGSYWNLSQPSNYFWSRTESGGGTAWYVALNSGFTTSNGESTAYQVRCVR